jgi:hypothetical protein
MQTSDGLRDMTDKSRIEFIYLFLGMLSEGPTRDKILPSNQYFLSTLDSPEINIF